MLALLVSGAPVAVPLPPALPLPPAAPMPPLPPLSPLPAAVWVTGEVVNSCQNGSAVCKSADELDGSIRCCKDEASGISICPPTHDGYDEDKGSRPVLSMPGRTVTGNRDASLHDAALQCNLHGYRLCTVTELHLPSGANGACNSGCGFNKVTHTARPRAPGLARGEAYLTLPY